MMLRQLITFPLVFIPLTILLPSCKNRKSRVEQHHSQTTVIKPSNNEPSAPTTNDTLQFIHFEGNYDYWSCVFLNSKKDTVTLVTDTVISGRYRNRIFLVTYFADTLYQAGDNDSKFTALRMSNFKVLGRKPFVDPITEQQILQDVWNLQEVQSGAEQVVIAERPTNEKNYYLVETGTHGEDNFSRFYMFRVYIYPNYEIRVYDPGNDTDISLMQWRGNSSK